MGIKIIIEIIITIIIFKIIQKILILEIKEISSFSESFTNELIFDLQNQYFY